MNRWELEQQLFEETAALDASARARVLRERACGDEDLVRRVERLAAADASPLAALDGTAADLWLALRDDAPPDSLCGATFGPYRVDEYVASGGMAHVYRATRTSAGAERRVALKVLRSLHAAVAGEDFLARFQREREVLASLEHEHVVAFLDAGALPDGRPFLVMEYVEGTPLTTWGRGVPLRRRLELFLQVLSAVQYAHQKLVLHRDLKPSNVLVTPQAVPKLLDFGIATALEPASSPAGERTAAPGPFTPAYASPEQLRGEAVSTASDVYSLGVLLRELATGEASDIDAIVEKALAPAPRERYGSVDEFGADLRRFLSCEPVAARGAQRVSAYRARLFVRRNRWPLTLASGIVVAAVAGWIGSDLRRRSAERDASRGWGAHSQAKTAAWAFEEWIASVAAADPSLGAAAATHLEESLKGRIAELPEAETMVRLALAEIYLRLGDRERAGRHAERAAVLAGVTPGVGPAERARAAELLERCEARAR